MSVQLGIEVTEESVRSFAESNCYRPLVKRSWRHFKAFVGARPEAGSGADAELFRQLYAKVLRGGDPEKSPLRPADRKPLKRKPKYRITDQSRADSKDLLRRLQRRHRVEVWLSNGNSPPQRWRSEGVINFARRQSSVGPEVVVLGDEEIPMHCFHLALSHAYLASAEKPVYEPKQQRKEFAVSVGDVELTESDLAEARERKRAQLRDTAIDRVTTFLQDRISTFAARLGNTENSVNECLDTSGLSESAIKTLLNREF